MQDLCGFAGWCRNKDKDKDKMGVVRSDGTRIQRRGRMMSVTVFQDDEDVIRVLYLDSVAQGVERRGSGSGK
jgi:hypothetical protein